MALTRKVRVLFFSCLSLVCLVLGSLEAWAKKQVDRSNYVRVSGFPFFILRCQAFDCLESLIHRSLTQKKLMPGAKLIQVEAKLKHFQVEAKLKHIQVESKLKHIQDHALAHSI